MALLAFKGVEFEDYPQAGIRKEFSSKEALACGTSSNRPANELMRICRHNLDEICLPADVWPIGRRALRRLKSLSRLCAPRVRRRYCLLR